MRAVPMPLGADGGELAAVSLATDAARSAFAASRNEEPSTWARLLRRIAEELEALGDTLLETADQETTLGLPRLTAERERTTGQLRALAEHVEAGDHLDVFIDRRAGDIRRVNVAVGPVGIFPASNFPLAFGVAGADTAAALAAGCPVVVKGHPSHPATSELCAGAVQAAVEWMRLPSGVFSLLQGASYALGAALVAADIEAVAFTGSLAGGRALYDLAARRPRPIPVYAEMGSINPVFVTPSAATDTTAEGLAASMTMGTGQFCTKPGVAFIVEGLAATRFIEHLVTSVSDKELHPMLDERIATAFGGAVAALHDIEGVEIHTATSGATIVVTDLTTWRSAPALQAEHFGPATVVVRCPDEDALLAAADDLEGSLTASVHAADAASDATAAALVQRLVDKVGRIVWNGWPTGVAVTPAMLHGGPYPASTAPAHTSVGATAIRRFLRPVAFQGLPAALLPAALADDAPGLRWVDGTWCVGQR